MAEPSASKPKRRSRNVEQRGRTPDGACVGHDPAEKLGLHARPGVDPYRVEVAHAGLLERVLAIDGPSLDGFSEVAAGTPKPKPKQPLIGPRRAMLHVFFT